VGIPFFFDGLGLVGLGQFGHGAGLCRESRGIQSASHDITKEGAVTAGKKTATRDIDCRELFKKNSKKIIDSLNQVFTSLAR
jgi:hypothetical protein